MMTAIVPLFRRLRPASRRMFSVMLCFGALLVSGGAAEAIEITRVISPGGLEAWLVEDHANPVIAVEALFEGGQALDPPGKEGLASLVAGLLDEGAADIDSQTFQSRLRDAAISLEFEAGRDSFSVSLKTLSDNQAEAYNLTRLALTQPRFDSDAIARIKNAILSQIRAEQSDPTSVARKVFNETIYPDHPYGRNAQGALETVPALSVEDLRGFVRNRFGRDRVLVAAAGDLTPEQLGRVVDELFGGLPEKAASAEIPEAVVRAEGRVSVVERPIPQSIVVFGQQGVKRNDPEWFPASIFNYVLGGGGLSSRLMREIREKRGLTYGIYSTLAPREHGALVMGSASTVNAKAGEALALLRQEWRRMADEGVTQEELADAKTYMTGAFPLQLNSTTAIARIALQVRRDRLGIDYLKRRSGLIEAVSLEDVRRVAKRLLDPDRLTVVVVGKPAGVVSSPQKE
ncbi:zinc protease [Azospirillaceae bacterium]